MSASESIVSVIMPCYNQGQYLDEAIDSVRAQTYPHVEVIVINDGSTDADTIDLLHHYHQPKVSIIHTENRGPAAARNAGIEQAQGNYILPLDADDRIAPTYLEQAVKCLDADTTVGIVYCEAEFFGEKTGRFELPPFNFPGILLGNMIFNSSVYRRTDWEKVGGYKDNFHGWEDYDFWLSLLELGRGVVRLPDVLYFYRQIASSRSNSMTRQHWIDDYTRLFQNHPSLYTPNMRVLFEHIVDLREDVHSTHTRLGETQVELVQTHTRLSDAYTQLTDAHSQMTDVHTQLAHAQAELSAIKNSKFGRLYKQYVKLKQLFLGRQPDQIGQATPTRLAIASISPTHIPQKLVKLVKVWRERGTLGTLTFIQQRIQTAQQHRFTYDEWVARNQLTPAAIENAQKQMAQWTERPKFSVIMPVYNVEAEWLEKAIQSVRQQIYPEWELCIADDASTKPHIKRLLTHYSKLDPRIKVVFRSENGQIAAASNSALAIATGDYIALLDHDDELAADALFENARLINQHPETDFIYSDEDKITPQGKRLDPFFKPDWSPDYFHACMYTCHLGVYRTSLMRAIDGFRPGYDGSQDYDLVLRVVEKTNHIRHIPKILYHWRIIPASVTAGGEQAKPWAYLAARRALEDMLARSPYPGWVEETPDRPGFWRVRRHLVGEPLVSIVIPSAGKALETPDGSQIAIETCIRSIQERSTYRKFEIVLVDGYDILEATLAAIAAPNVRLVRCAEPFNFAQRINQGAANAIGQFLLLLNDDTEVITPDWLEVMLEFAQQDDIGAVGAKLLFPDGTLQHNGVMVLHGNPGHAYHGFDGNHPGYFCSNIVNRNYLAVTAACLMMRRDLFQQLGGMDEIFPLNYNDVDLCLKAHQAGYRNVVTPHAQLIHYESVSRSKGLQPKEWETLNHKWKAYFDTLHGDPYYNPNLSHRAVTFEL